jgi:hypothetical protein
VAGLTGATQPVWVMSIANARSLPTARRSRCPYSRASRWCVSTELASVQLPAEPPHTVTVRSYRGAGPYGEMFGDPVTIRSVSWRTDAALMRSATGEGTGQRDHPARNRTSTS